MPIQDVRIYYEIHGDGPPLLLLHGGLGHGGYWEKQLPALSRKYRVITMDSRGHGRSTYSEQPIRYELMASDVVALMDSLNIEEASILGWSDGGIIGLALALDHPERVHKLIAFGANYDPSGVRSDIGESQVLNDYFEKAAADYQRLSPDPSRWDTFVENLGRMWVSEPKFTAEQLGRITVPVLVLGGENDEFVRTEHTREMAGLIPRAELVLIPGAGHFAAWEKPEAFNKIVLGFLAE